MDTSTRVAPNGDGGACRQPQTSGPTHPDPSDFPTAWQPFTPRGVAAFAGASLGRLWLVELLMGLMAGAVLVWFLDQTWCPVVEQAIQQLSAQGEVRRGQLEWGSAPRVLAEDHFLSVAVNPGAEDLADAADIQIVFSRRELRLRSLLGWMYWPYPAEGRIPFNRTELWPWWGAWRPALLAAVLVATVAGLLLIWALLAALYAPLVRLVAFFANRASTWTGNWRLASAALMPGAVAASAGIVLYGLGILDMVRLGLVMVFHLVVGWVYLAISPLFLPPSPAAAAPPGNPFLGASSSSSAKDNPFATPPQ